MSHPVTFLTFTSLHYYTLAYTLTMKTWFKDTTSVPSLKCCTVETSFNYYDCMIILLF